MKTKKKPDIDSVWKELVSEGKEAGRERNLNRSREKFAKAYEVSREFDEGDARRGESAYYLAYAKYVNHESNEAANLFREALSYMTKNPEQRKQCVTIYSILGAIYFGLHDLEKAEESIKESLKLEDKNSTESWENIQLLASILVTLKKYREAAPVLEKLIGYQQQVNPEEVPKTIKILAFVSQELGDLKAELRWKKELLKSQDELKQSTSSVITQDQVAEEPTGWGKDRIGHYIDTSRRNQFASYQKEYEIYERLEQIDLRFRDSQRNLTLHMMDILDKEDPDIPFKDLKIKDEDWLELYFFMQAHSSYLSAVSSGLSANGPGTYTLLRACLENAMYGFFVSKENQLKKVWLERNNGPQERQKVRDEFKVGRIKKLISNTNSALGQRVSDLYDVTIDEGAHPNVSAYLANALQKNEAGELILAVAYLNPGSLADQLTHVEAVGEVVLDVFAEIFPDLVD